MVFANLQPHEKEAFFSLLDEYFASRPEIFNAASQNQTGPANNSGINVRVSPEAATKLVSSGLKNASAFAARSNAPAPQSTSTSSSNMAFNSEFSKVLAGRVAAASQAFSGHNDDNSASSEVKNPPPAPPRRGPSSSGPEKSSGAPGLLSVKKFGDVDTSSTKNMFTSLRSSTANKSVVHPPPAVPAAFALKKNAFAPPPVRRVSTPPAPPPRQPPPQEEPEEEEAQGEWVEALYDYSSEDPGDLEIHARQRFLLVERTSDDWWTGEVDGKRGLFPASYVKVL